MTPVISMSVCDPSYKYCVWCALRGVRYVLVKYIRSPFELCVIWCLFCVVHCVCVQNNLFIVYFWNTYRLLKQHDLNYSACGMLSYSDLKMWLSMRINAKKTSMTPKWPTSNESNVLLCYVLLFAIASPKIASKLLCI